jgi:beta-phosphoglucomutase
LIKACIFDLDGVIVDTARYHYLAWRRLAEEIGVDFTESDNERLKGVSRMRSLEIICELGGVVLSQAEMEQMADKKNGWFKDYVAMMNPGEIFPGVKALIDDLKGMGIAVALASSSKNAQTVVHRLGIEDTFDAIVDGNMVVHSKPDPEIFLLAARQLGMEPESCVVFEDAEAGVDAALAAGMKCVGVGSPARLGHAHIVIKNTGEFEIPILNEL